MSGAFDDGGPGVDPGPAVATRAERPALARIVGDPDAFARRTWGRDPLLLESADPGGFVDLLSEASVDELLGQRGLRTPFLRVAKDGTTLGNAAFTAPGGLGAGIADQVSDDKLSALFAGGSTIVLQALHRVWPPIIDFCQQLAADLGHPVQANAYVTPPQNQGFDDHYDVHDVFVLQVAGRKKWSIHAPVHPSPLRDQPWTDRREAVRRAAEQEPVIETVLEPGDALYLPRGYLHSATALGGVTVHLTLGVHSWTRYDVAEELVALALQRLADRRGGAPFAAPRHRSARRRARRGARQRQAPGGAPSCRARRHRVPVAGTEARGTTSRTARPPGPARPARPRSPTTPRCVCATTSTRAWWAARWSPAPARVPVDAVPDDVLKRLLAGDVLTSGELGLDSTRTLIEAGLVVAG